MHLCNSVQRLLSRNGNLDQKEKGLTKDLLVFIIKSLMFSCGESLSSSDNDLLVAAELLAAGKKCVKTILKESCYTAISTTLLVETSGIIVKNM